MFLRIWLDLLTAQRHEKEPDAGYTLGCAVILSTLIFAGVFLRLREVVFHLHPSQTSGLDPNALENLIAISGEIAALSLMTLLSVWRVTPRRRAASFTVGPNGRCSRGGHPARVRRFLHAHIKSQRAGL